MSKKLQTISFQDDLDILPKKIQEEIDEISKKKKLNTVQKKKLIEAVKEEYLNNRFEPGEAIGIISAQSISEPATQMTMRTYHYAGSAGIQITLGLPRLIEIFGAGKPITRIMTIYLKEKYNTKKLSEKVAEKIKEKKLRNFIKTISLDVTNKRIKIKLKEVKKSEKEEIGLKLNKVFKNYRIKMKKGAISVEPEKEELMIKDLEKIKKKLLDLHISGILEIKNTLVLEDGKDWVIKTLGSNFNEVLCLDEVDANRCYTNDIHEIANVLGIEAARNALIKEIVQTMQQQGLNIDERHIMLVADVMTSTGRVRSVGRYGVAGMSSSVLTRAGFEETKKHLVKASVTGEVDDFSAIFDNVMVNQQVPVGTGMFELIAKMVE